MSFQKLMAAGVMMAVAATLAIAPAQANEGAGHDGAKMHKKCAEGQQCHRGQGKFSKEDREKMHAKFKQELGLTDAQEAKLKAAREANKEQNKAKFEAMKANRQKLRELKQSGQGDSAEAQAIKSQMKANFEAMKQEHEATLQSVLTPEQFEKFQTMKAERKARWEAKKQERKQQRGAKDKPAS